MIDDCLAVIMAGGDSQRMGRDKASLVLGEQTLMQRVAEIMQVVFPQVVVSVRTPRADIALPQVCDVFSDLGPLAGLCAGLDYASQDGVPWIFAVATDMPFLRPALIEQLATLEFTEAAHNAGTLAARLHVSTRTLHRQLQEEGSSLQALKDAVRQRRATELLLRSPQAIKQVAQAVGFASEKSFMRAFRGWTGQSPADFRRQSRG